MRDEANNRLRAALRTPNPRFRVDDLITLWTEQHRPELARILFDALRAPPGTRFPIPPLTRAPFTVVVFASETASQAHKDEVFAHVKKTFRTVTAERLMAEHVERFLEWIEEQVTEQLMAQAQAREAVYQGEVSLAKDEA